MTKNTNNSSSKIVLCILELSGKLPQPNKVLLSAVGKEPGLFCCASQVGLDKTWGKRPSSFLQNVDTYSNKKQHGVTPQELLMEKALFLWAGKNKAQTLKCHAHPSLWSLVELKFILFTKSFRIIWISAQAMSYPNQHEQFAWWSWVCHTMVSISKSYLERTSSMLEAITGICPGN